MNSEPDDPAPAVDLLARVRARETQDRRAKSAGAELIWEVLTTDDALLTPALRAAKARVLAAGKDGET